MMSDNIEKTYLQEYPNISHTKHNHHHPLPTDNPHTTNNTQHPAPTAHNAHTPAPGVDGKPLLPQWARFRVRAVELEPLVLYLSVC